VGAKRTYSDEQLISAVAQSKSVAQVLGLLGLRPAGGNYKTVQLRMTALGLDASHFTRQGWNRGMKFDARPVRPLSEVLVEGSNYQSFLLRRRLVSEGLKAAQCEECLSTTWNAQPIPLELEHVNGRNDDNRFENLKLLCPNCHAQTPTYRGRNIGKRQCPRTPTRQREGA
jgi:5-methylcytosine-specific restriction endonuclease McrA